MTILGILRPNQRVAADEVRGVLRLCGVELPSAAPPGGVERFGGIAQTGALEPASEGESVACWLDGRLFATEELAREYNLVGAASHTALLAEAYRRGLLERLLPRLNGDFVAVLHDRVQGKWILVTDRLGLRPVYVRAAPAEFLFCSRLRGFLGFRGFEPQISEEALACFLDLGHMVGDLTWFQGVTLLPPATWLEVDVASAKVVAQRHYWRWSEIQPIEIAQDEAAEELERLLRQAVARRVLPGESVHVLLSGGLDSRAMLACLGEGQCAGTATFGQAGCRDMLYAGQAALAAGVPHVHLSMERENWDQKRFQALWKCDGMSSILDLSALQFVEEMRRLAPVNLNGFSGDLVAGGSYLNPKYLDRPVDAEFAAKRFGPHAKWTESLRDYTDSPHTDPYVLAHRVRRNTVAGTLELEDQIEQRKPFMDNDLLEFLYALPERYRLDGAVYHPALLRLGPKLFRSIPWQKTGRPIAASGPSRSKWSAAPAKWAAKLGWSRTPMEFHDIEAWAESSKEKYTALLQDPEALWRSVVPEHLHTRFDADWRQLVRKRRKLFRAISVEVWLRQVFRSQHR